MKETMKQYQNEIDESIFRTYSKGTKLDFMKETTKLNIHDLAQITSGSEYHYWVLQRVKEMVPAQYQLSFLYQLKPLEVFDIELSKMIREYHLNKDHKYFRFWMETYYQEISHKKTSKEKELLKEVGTGIYEFKVSKKDLTYVSPGLVLYNIGNYKNNPITIDMILKSNWKYAYYIIKTFDNSPFQHVFYYIYCKLEEMRLNGIISIDSIQTCIPLKQLKKEYNRIYKK